MIEHRNNKQNSFFGNYVYDKVVKKEHLLRKINEIVDFSFVNKQCRDLYCLNNGRPGWSPSLMFKILFLQFMYDLSDYAIEEELYDRLSFKMFIGLEVEEPPPDHSSVSRFRDRLGVERFKKIFNKIVELARDKGVISDKLHIVDATEVKAKVDLYRLKKEHRDSHPKDYIDRHSPDPDARSGRKYKGKPFYGYQAHCAMDAESEVIVNIDAAPGDVREHTQLKPLLQESPSPKVVTADKAYDCQENHRYLSENHIRNGIMLKKFHTKEYLKTHIQRVSRKARKFRQHIEHKMAHLKRYHGLAKARYWGCTKVRIQTYLAAMCSNVKRLVQLCFGDTFRTKICLKGTY